MLFNAWTDAFLFALAPVAFLPLIGMGIGALGSWLGGRSRSKQHERQLSSEDKRHAESLAARERELQRRSDDWREYARMQMAAEQAFRERQASALRALGGAGIAGAGGLAGLPVGFDLGMLAQAPGGAVVPPGAVSGPAGAAMPITTAGLPPGGGGGDAGMLDYLSLALGQGGDTEGGWRGLLGIGAAKDPLPSGPTGMPSYLPMGPRSPQGINLPPLANPGFSGLAGTRRMM